MNVPQVILIHQEFVKVISFSFSFSFLDYGFTIFFSLKKQKTKKQKGCHFSCKTCNGADSTNCLNCHAYLNFFSLTNECLDSCPQGFYSNTTNSIKSCQRNLSFLLFLFSFFFFRNLLFLFLFLFFSVECDSECETCNGYGNNQCLTCVNNSAVFLF